MVMNVKLSISIFRIGVQISNYKTSATVIVTFPGKAVVNYVLPKDEKIAYGIHYGIGTTGESAWTKLENGDTFQINVTKYEGNVIEGTFSGEATDMNQNSKRTSLKNCSFKSSLPIGVQ